MSRVTRRFAPPTPSQSAPSVNREGYPAYSRPIEEQALQILLTNNLGNTFYADAKTLLSEAEAVFHKCIEKDVDFFSKALVYARQEGFMRSVPVFGLAILSEYQDKSFFKKVFSHVIWTPDDLFDFLTVIQSRRKGEGGRAVKSTAGNWLALNIGEYWAIKYGSEHGQGYGLKDAFITLHPKPELNSAPYSALVSYIMGRATNEQLALLPQVQAFEALKKAESPEAKIEAITAGRIPHEEATSFAGKDKAVWNSIVQTMPIFALVRNLKTLESVGVLDSNRKHITDMLSSQKVIGNSHMFPFRFTEAAKHVQAQWVQDALRVATELSFQNLQDIHGEVAIFIDNSGSMKSYLQTAAIFGVALAKKSENVTVRVFNDNLVHFNVSRLDSLMTQADAICELPSGGTETSLTIEWLLSEKKKVDTIILITDEQQNNGTPFMDKMQQYRQSVNKDVRLYVIDVAPYGEAIVPEDPKNFFVYGWTDRVLDVIALTSQGWSGITQIVKEKTL